MGFDYAGKIRALLANAESHREKGNDEAAAAFEAKAFQFMRDYKIAEEEALATDPSVAVPIPLVIEFKMDGYEMSSFLVDTVRAIAEHTGCRVNTTRLSDWMTWQFTLVGYEGDIRYAEFLWTSAFLMFTTKVSPTWDASLPETENIYRMRQAGHERRTIADRAWGPGAGDEAKNRSKVQRIYLKEAAARGEMALATGLGFDAKRYRQAYAEAFVATLRHRLRVARDAADSTGGALVFAGRQDRVNEAFYELFPNMRPSTAPATPWVDPTTDCPKCAKAKTTCNDHAYMRPRGWTQADQARWERDQYSPSARAGRSSGRTAAEGVMLRGDHTKAQRVERSGKAIEG